MSMRWLIAMIMFFMICTLISNILEQQDIFTASQITGLEEMHQQQFTESQELSTGITTTGINPLTVLNAIWKSLTIDYSFLYDVRDDLSQAQCIAISNATWQSASSTCKIPNVWYMPFLILLWGPIVAVGFFLVLTIWHAIRGGGI